MTTRREIKLRTFAPQGLRANAPFPFDLLTRVFPKNQVNLSHIQQRHWHWLSWCTYKNLLQIFSYRLSLSSFHTCSLFYVPSNECWIVFVPSPNALPLIYLTIGFFIMELLLASQIRLKATNRKGQRQHFYRSYILASSLDTNRRVGA